MGPQERLTVLLSISYLPKPMRLTVRALAASVPRPAKPSASATSIASERSALYGSTWDSAAFLAQNKAAGKAGAGEADPERAPSGGEDHGFTTTPPFSATAPGVAHH